MRPLLSVGFLPAAIARHIKIEAKEKRVSHETLYQLIYLDKHEGGDLCRQIFMPTVVIESAGDPTLLYFNIGDFTYFIKRFSPVINSDSDCFSRSPSHQ